MSETTVILPVYNGEAYLRASIDSVVEQQDSDFDFLICDDCSKDGSDDIIRSYSDRKNVRVIRNEQNRGLFFTLNRLVRESSGRRIRMWSQDDIMLPGCLRDEDAFWRDHPDIGMCYSAYHTIDDRGEIEREAIHDPTPEVVEPWLADQISFYHGCMTGNIATTSFRRDAFEKVGAFQDQMKVSGDFDFNIKISQHYTIGRQRKPVVHVRNHHQQLSRLSQSSLYSINENDLIINELYSRMPESLKLNARHYRVHYYDVGIFHHSVRAFLSGRFHIFYESSKFLAKRMRLPQAAFWWLFSLNRRYFMPPTLYLSASGKSYTNIQDKMP